MVFSRWFRKRSIWRTGLLSTDSWLDSSRFCHHFDLHLTAKHGETRKLNITLLKSLTVIEDILRGIPLSDIKRTQYKRSVTNFYPSLGWIESAGGYFTAPLLQHRGFGGSSPEKIYLGLSPFHLNGFLVLWFAFGHGLTSTLHRRHRSILGVTAKRKRQAVKIQIE